MIPNNTDELLKEQKANSKLSELFDKMKKARDCDENDEEDCGDLLSPCCNSQFQTVFGSIPLMVECLNCHQKFMLKQLMDTVTK